MFKCFIISEELNLYPVLIVDVQGICIFNLLNCDTDTEETV